MQKFVEHKEKQNEQRNCHGIGPKRRSMDSSHRQEDQKQAEGKVNYGGPKARLRITEKIPEGDEINRYLE